MDRERGSFGFKESRLADFYIDILGLAKNSHDAYQLKNWEHQSRSGRSDFAEAIHEVVKSRLGDRDPDHKSISIARLNELLDELNQSPDKKEALSRLIFCTCAEEQKWMVRIVLKNIRIGLGDAMIFKCLHPDAQDYYNLTSNLRRICEELKNPAVRLNLAHPSLEIGSPFAPMLANREALEFTMEHMPTTGAIVEPKLDGERMQLHYHSAFYRFWSRRGTEYTYLYGRTKDEGSLAPHIQGCFTEDVKSIILDGEMLAYDPITKDFMPFGTLKTAADASNIVKLHDPHPCFVAFDIVYLNGQSLLDRPLSERKVILEQHLKPIEGYLIIIEGTKVSTTEELINEMDLALSNKLEGIIVKSPDSKYFVGKRNNEWIKLKPDYVDSLCDDLDLLVVGGSYGRGVGGAPGSVSSLMCAVWDDAAGRWKTLCRVGSGLTVGELDRLRARLGPYLFPHYPKNPPDWVDVISGPDKPDLVISDPSKSIVIQVKAAQLAESKVYPTGLTLRHPRYVRERNDRRWDSAMTLKELEDLWKSEKGSLAKRSLANIPRTNPKRTKVLRGKWAQAKLSSDFSTIDPSKVKRSEHSVFKDIEIFVLAGEENGLDKMDLEKMIIELGGKITQAPVLGKTLCVLSGKDGGLRIANIKKQGIFDIVKTEWFHECITAGRMVPFKEEHMILISASTKAKLSADGKYPASEHFEEPTIDHDKSMQETDDEQTELDTDLEMKFEI